MKLNKIKNDPFKIKIVFGIIIAIAIFAILFSIFFLGSVGKIIGFIFYLVMTILALFELSNILLKVKWVKFYVPLSSLIVFLFPTNTTFDWFRQATTNNIKSQFIFEIGVPGLGYLIFGLFLLLPFLIDWINTKKINKHSLITFLILYIFSILITFAGKNIFLSNIQNDSNSFRFIICLALVVISVDSFSYIGGRLLGNRFFSKKLAPTISPNKTIEGAIIGYLLGLVISFLLFNYLSPFNFKDNITNIVMNNCLIPISLPFVVIIGDLSFSFVKRKYDVKDFSNFVPEHGGILDRLDSMIVSSFIYSILFVWL